MHKFLEKFALVAKRPGMYLPNGQLTEATNFVAGMDFMQDRSLGEEFGKWLLKNELESKSSVYWPTIKIAPAKPEVFNVSRSKRLQGRFAASRLATKVAG